jgi:hypothetical protein
MQPHQHRVTVERAELNEKIEKLAKFFDTEMYQSLPMAEQGRMLQQLKHMIDYRHVLDNRIAAFT